MAADFGSSRGAVLAGALWLLAWSTAASLAQTKPPVSAVPEPFRQRFVQYVDRRSMQERALNLVHLTSEDLGRSLALIAGVSKYPNMQEFDRDLPAAAADIDALQDYLRNQEFFDEVVVLKDGDVTMENLEYFLQDYFPDRLRKTPKCRFLFAYSGHGMVEGPKDNPTGYLLKSTARDFQDKLNSINMAVLRVYVDQVIDAGYQTIVLINACHSGAFLSRRPFGEPSGQRSAGGIYGPQHGGAHAITAGGTNQLTWHDPRVGKGSVFFEKLLAGLGGQADTYPIHPDGHRGDGVITVDEIATYLREEVSLATNEEQIPIPADLALNRSLGGFFFLSRARLATDGIAPEWTPRRGTPFGVEAEETFLKAKQYWDDDQFDKALPLLRSAAASGHATAAAYLGWMYEFGVEVEQDETEAVAWIRRAAEAGETEAMVDLGSKLREGLCGLAKNEAEAVSWYRKAADAGDAGGMNSLGIMYWYGLGGLEKDDTQAVIWYRRAAEAGERYGMNNLGRMYELGQGGLPPDDAQAVSWYRRAANSRAGPGMANLGRMYELGRGGLPRDDTQAAIWYREAANAGDVTGMYNLAVMYERGGGGLPQDETQAVEWYRRAADIGNDDAAKALKRLGR